MPLTIRSARITPLPSGVCDPIPQVYVTTAIGEQFLFDYYPDEIRFTAHEFVGLTVVEAVHLKYAKDRAFLRD